MNNRRIASGARVTHILSTILAKVNNIEKQLSPSIFLFEICLLP